MLMGIPGRSGGIVNNPRCKVIELVLGSYIPADPICLDQVLEPPWPQFIGSDGMPHRKD
jgi:hypothetical protein